MQALENFLAESKQSGSRYFSIANGIDPSRKTATQPTETEVKEWIEQKVKTFDVLIFSKQDCQFCKRAIRLMNGLTQFLDVLTTIEIIELNPIDAKIIQPVLQTLTAQQTVPNIYIKRKHIGGYDKFCDYLHGSLKRIEHPAIE